MDGDDVVSLKHFGSNDSYVIGMLFLPTSMLSQWDYKHVFRNWNLYKTLFQETV